MMDKLINSNIVFLQKHGIKIHNDDKDAYCYALKILYSYIIDLTLIFSLSYLFNRLYESMIMTFLFAVLQVFGGGYHAKSKPKCTLLMLAGCGIGNIMMSILVDFPLVMLLMTATAYAMIFVHVPVMNSNHPVSKKVYQRSKYIIRSIVLMLFIVVLTLRIFNQYDEMSIVVSTLCLYSASVYFAIKE